jgi:uncharacterized ferredoxin-like protein
MGGAKGENMIIKSIEAENRSIETVAGLMIAAARTAPKACGIDNIEAFVATGGDKDAVAAAMKEIAARTDRDVPFARDAENLEACPAVVFIGVKNAPIDVNPCGLCGFADCGDMTKHGANCAFNVTDLGIALGSAVAIARDNGIDNRIMYSAGKGALQCKLFSERVRVCYGIPLSATGKSPFFDRG